MKTPKFKDEDDEAQWIYDNREQLGEEFAQAMRDGKTVNIPSKQFIERILAAKAASAPINIRIPNSDLALARELAEKKGIEYQTLIQSLLHEALQRESKQV